MPAYSVRCPTCGNADIIYRRVEDRNTTGQCRCGSAFERILEFPMIQPEIEPYHSPNGGRLISSRAERRADLSRSNAIEWEPGIEKDIARKGVYEKEKAFEPISRAVDDIVRDMNVCGKLENLNA